MQHTQGRCDKAGDRRHDDILTQTGPTPRAALPTGAGAGLGRRRCSPSRRSARARRASPWAMPSFAFSPRSCRRCSRHYVKRSQRALEPGPGRRAPAGDKRFAPRGLGRNPVAAFSAAVYLLNARTLLGLAEATEGDAKTKARLRFAVEQWIAAAAPSNYLALNAEAQQKAHRDPGREHRQRHAEPAGRHAAGPRVA